MAFKLDSKIPAGELAQKWSNHKAAIKVVSPANKRKLDIIVVGTGLGGASAAASLGELGYNVKVFCIQDSPRRAHSIAAQGGINAAKNYRNDNDSIYRLFYDTIKGGDYRAREANVYRMAEVSNCIIDQCVGQGVPFAREYGGMLDNRSFGGAQVSRTFYARGQTGQQLLLGAYAALNKEIAAGSVKSYPRHEMLDIVIYLVWFFALWFHLTHGVWSMFQSVGWGNDIWYPRLKCIANIVATVVFLGFAVVVLVYFFRSLCCGCVC